MNLKKKLFIAGLGILLMMFATTQSFAGSDPTLPTTGVVQGPDVWGVVVVNCVQNSEGDVSATLRVKQIADCNVYTEAAAMEIGPNCPVQESNVLYYQPSGLVLHDQNGAAIPGQPIFTKVKNFNCTADTCSFDVLVNFWVQP